MKNLKMKNVICQMALALACAASLVWITSCASSAPQTNAPSAGKTATKDYYTCAMHPEVHFQNPDGKCPICGMPLMPASEIPDGPNNH